ncbi:MAG: CoA transferase [Anaerolineae bacterium]|nr:CoA transferase [Anaerolineae bacterium]
MSYPLEGLRVLDFSWFLAGPYATMILADLGADVVKVEAPERGDPSRTAGPFANGVSGYFLSVNRNKRSIVLDLKSEAGRARAAKLAGRADVVVENFVPGTMKRWGLDYATLAETNSRLIYASCTGFGQTGPRALESAFDLVIQALAGTMSITGEAGAAPVRVGNSIGDLGGALYLTIGILAALQARHRTGRGQALDLSMMDAQVALLENAFMRYFVTGETPARLGSRHPLIVPFQAFPTSDGYVVVTAGTEAQWGRLCEALGASELKEDARFLTNTARRQNIPALETELSARFKTRTTDEWLEILRDHEIPCAPIQTIAQAASDPQIAAREMIVNVEDAQAGTQRIVNTPLRFSEMQSGVRTSAPQLGEHTDEILRDWLAE